jgi:SAM-dependent methyltransferase
MTNAALSTQLNLGCGHDIRDGWVNLDSAGLPGVDVVHNLDDLPIPLPDGRFTEIVCKDILEHVDVVPVMAELHRLLAPGGRLRIQSPHFTSRNFYIDPTHRKAFSVDTFDFFTRNSSHERSYYFDFAFSAIESVEITFMTSPYLPWNRLVAPLINRSRQTQRYYEWTGLSRVFPAHNVKVTLIR